MPEHVFDGPEHPREARTPDERRAGTSLEQFGAVLQNSAARRALGLDISDDSAARTAHDPAAIGSLYERWVSTGAETAEPARPGGDERHVGAQTVAAENAGLVTPAGRSRPQHDRRAPVGRLRLAWAAAVALLLAAVWVFTAPEALDEPTDWSQQLRSAENAFTGNDARTEGAPQQQVVNGWYSNDLAAIQVSQLATQQDQAAYGHALEARTAALLALLVLAFAGDLALRALETRPQRPSGATV